MPAACSAAVIEVLASSKFGVFDSTSAHVSPALKIFCSWAILISVCDCAL